MRTQPQTLFLPYHALADHALGTCRMTEPLDLYYLNALDVARLALTDDEIVAAVDAGLRAQGKPVCGRNVLALDPIALRRSIGYVIQQVGLFPHWSIADNIATVPRLLGWDEVRIRTRVDELLALVGMDPGSDRDRFPRELSGGQRQRIGVARALAADPPVMLMDEPFGAIDPITRSRLQAEFLKILHGLRKTIVFVTHDIDEAIRIGDRIAILRDGALVQYDTPEALLARPADAFVEEFVGADRALKRLALITTAAVIVPAGDNLPKVAIAAEASLRDALALMFSAGVDAVAITGPGTAPPSGIVTLARIRQRLRVLE
jgi:osmoprotectant transport system ATP-binding protein